MTTLRTGYLGPAGTFASEAALLATPDAEQRSYATIEAVFEALAAGDIDRGLVPIENVIQGPVTETLDALFEYADRVVIADMLVLAVEHALGSYGSLDEIRVVRSKDQALKQCTKYLASELADAATQDASSTSAAIEEAARDKRKDLAAIGNERAMERYGLPVLARNIGNVRNNKTRFVLLGPASLGYRSAAPGDATAFVVHPKSDRIGILEEILGVVSRQYGLSLSSIHSRPDTRGGFRFYMEVEGHIGDAAVVGCLDTLRARLAGDMVEIRVFGSYPRCPFTRTRIRTIGIVGGTGQMGQWLQRFFEGAGYEVLVSGRATKLDYAQCVQQSDAVVVNVPITNTPDVIRDIGPHLRHGQLIADNTSIKTQPVAAMLDAVADDVEVLGMHTVFGPAAESLAKQNVVFTRTKRSGELAREFENIFYKHGAIITYTDPANHDRQMAFHQNLEHFSKLVLASVLRDTFDDPAQMDSYSSPNSRASLATMGRVLSADTELLLEIQSLNLMGPDMLDRFVDAAQGLRDALVNGDLDAVRASVRKSKEHLGADFLRELKRRSRDV